MPVIDIRRMAELRLRSEAPPSGDGELPSVAPYTHGLNGVNITTDNISSRGLYSSIGLVCIVVVLIRLMQRAHAHIRHVMTLTSTPQQQNFWRHDQNTFWPGLKKHLLYAPLKNKRHNREIQLSAAVNVGTIPSRLQTLLLVAFMVSNLVYIMLLDYSNPNKAALIAELRGRSGHLSTMNMIALFVMAGRNNPFIRILRVSFDTFNLFHRWIGRVIIIEAIIHTIAWGANKQTAMGWSGVGKALSSDPFIQYGTLGTAAMLIVLIQSPSAVRHAFYETFLHLHQLLAFLAMLGIFFHAKLGHLPQMPYIVLIICIWFYDRIFRVIRIVWRNVSWRNGLSRVTVEALPGEACRVTFHLPKPWTPPPGSHVYAYLPAISLWQSHPFSVAWTSPARSEAELEAPLTKDTSDFEKDAMPLPPTNASVSLVMSARTGMTRKLYDRASRAPLHRIKLHGLLEGPYGSLESLHSYGTVLLFAGGVGITDTLSHIKDLLTRHDDGTAAARKVALVWTVRSTDQLEWVRPWMDEILALPARRALLKIMVFVTRPRSAREVQSASARVLMFPGRPQPAVIVEKEFRERVGAMCVRVCGPGALADDVRAATRNVVDLGKVDFWEESFTW